MPTTTIYLLSGNPQAIIETHKVAKDARIIPFSEKQILSIGKTIGMLRSDPSEIIIFAAKSLVLQRYHQIIKGMMLLAGVRRGVLLDEQGVIVKYSPLRVIFLDSFRLLFEILASIWLLCITWSELFLTKNIEK
ncbi:MAG: hypothetical protein HYZ42_13430 [Bacteroidetes bacterium]|nr:hypothetical protein [Bacteroidota bacterium]